MLPSSCAAIQIPTHPCLALQPTWRSARRRRASWLARLARCDAGFLIECTNWIIDARTATGTQPSRHQPNPVFSLSLMVPQAAMQEMAARLAASE